MFRKKIKVIFLSWLFFSSLFAMTSLLSFWSEWNKVLVVSSLGGFIGLVAAPEFDDKLFKSDGQFYQTVGGLFGGGVIVYLAGGQGVYMILGMFLGMLFGFTAKYWVNHMNAGWLP